MVMLFKRINDVINANLHDLVDRVEDPERMIKQIIREMEDNVAGARERVIDAVASEKRLGADVERHRQQARSWREKARTAVEAGSDDLARSALNSAAEQDQLLAGVEPAWQAAQGTSAHLKTQLKALTDKLEEARHKRGALLARQRVAEARAHIEHTGSNLEAGLAAHATFGRMEDRVADMEARTAAIVEINGLGDDPASAFSQLQRELSVEAELANLKRASS